jgi:hypothetical protein
MLGSDVVHAEPGDLVYKPRDVWHTFWNATDRPARLLEIISPAGFEELFVELNDLLETDPENIGAAAALGANMAFEATRKPLHVSPPSVADRAVAVGPARRPLRYSHPYLASRHGLAGAQVKHRCARERSCPRSRLLQLIDLGTRRGLVLYRPDGIVTS